ncbi:cytochrome c biogenesis protein CcsA [Mesobacillus sp. AQ2]|jgi:HemX protein|uniref:cytochrome C assembly family protein n=1 Tax=Bacillaceae TaxID=186817 RepID=UPI0011A0AA84|nr:MULTISPECIES: cytochrome c biogenesis protein CcsA [Bacillaceae]MCM3122604.1 cytochrome c biogenesis protein [Mesobacillus sp. MER 33]MCM3232568.1 cytochrome c biogenesis protein [Mesobacillus sp. MER 48]WHX39499.1 cytochrome c biogenesis protein CcsA [Mesobacillus sp. AQ2]
MGDLYITRLHEITIVIYAASVLLYFIDFLNRNRRANKVAFWLLAFVWVFQTVFLVFYMVDTGRFPVLTLFEGLYFYAWVLVTLSLAINKLLKVDFIVFFTNILGFIIMAIHTFAPVQYDSNVMSEQLVSELLLIHITMAILSYGAFSISFVFSLLYLIQYDLLKRKKWGKLLWRISDLSRLDYWSYILNVIGVPMLLLSLILGLQWAWIKVPDLAWYDAKLLGSFIVLAVYSIYLYLRVGKEMYGKALALLNIASFLIVLINFFLSGKLSSFHFWYQ